MSAESFLGPLEIAVVTSSVIFGITCMQCYRYYVQHSTNDLTPLKFLVSTLTIFEALHIALITHVLYFYTIKSYGNLTMSTGVLWSFVAQAIVSGLLSSITQCFFAIRIYYLNNHRPLIPFTIVAISLFLLAGTTYFNVLSFTASVSYRSPKNAVTIDAASMILFLMVFCDGIITTSTIYYLRKSQTRMPFASTNRVINKLIRYTLNTGLLTTIFALITGIVILVQKDMFTFTPFYLITTRLYACSVISILNSRAAVQKEFINISRETETADAVFTSVGFDSSACTTTYNGSE